MEEMEEDGDGISTDCSAEGEEKDGERPCWTEPQQVKCKRPNKSLFFAGADDMPSDELPGPGPGSSSSNGGDSGEDKEPSATPTAVAAEGGCTRRRSNFYNILFDTVGRLDKDSIGSTSSTSSCHWSGAAAISAVCNT